MKRIKQQTDWSCFAAVAAMITSAKVEDVYGFCGHDGGHEYPGGPLIHGIQRAGFHDVEIHAFLMSRGFKVGTSFALEDYGTNFEFPKDWRGIIAIVIVESTHKGDSTHSILWDGEKFLDPNPFMPDEPKVEDYEIIQFNQIQEYPKERESMYSRIMMKGTK